MHDPANKEKADAAREKARRARNSNQPLGKLKRLRLNSLKDIKAALEQILNEVRYRQIKISDAKCFAYIISIASQAIKDADIEIKISELEDRLCHRSKIS